MGVWLTHALVLGLALYMFRKRLTLPRFSFSKLVARLRRESVRVLSLTEPIEGAVNPP